MCSLPSGEDHRNLFQTVTVLLHAMTSHTNEYTQNSWTVYLRAAACTAYTEQFGPKTFRTYVRSV